MKKNLLHVSHCLMRSKIIISGEGNNQLVTKDSPIKVLTKNFVLAFLLLFFTLPSFAQEVNSFFTSGGIKYQITKAADVSGSGGEVSVAYNDYSGDIEIHSTVTYNNIIYSVTSIGDCAFMYCSGLTSVTIPSSVTSIGSEAFGSCTGLTSIIIPSSVTSIGNSAFRVCSSLQSISVEEGNTSYSSQDGILYNSAKTELIYCPTGKAGSVVTIPSSVTSIGSSAFQYCSRLTSITIPNSVTSIGNYAFSDCTGLTSVTIGTDVTSIGDRAFYNCTGLTSITIPNSVTSIGDWAFAYCSSLQSISVEEGNTSYSSQDGILYNSAKTELIYCPTGKAGSVVTIPSSVTSIDNYAFNSCIGLTSVTIPDGVTSIGNSAFYGCSGLTSINIPSSVPSISSSAFYGCSGLTSITIPDGVTSIGDWAFAYCSSLTSVTIPDGVTSIANQTFQNCTGLTSVTIPSSVTSIGSSAFQRCSGLTSITIPNSVTSISSSVFAFCSALISVTMEGTTPPRLVVSTNVFPTSNPGFTIYVPCGSRTAYTSAALWRNSSISSYITDALPAEITEDRYLASCDCDFPSTITIKDGASLSASSASSLSTKLSGKTVNVEKELAIDEFSLIGNIGGAINYDFIGSNIGNSTGFAHSMVALPFYYAGNSWGVDADGNGARNGTHTPVSYGESFFVYPTTNQYGEENSPIAGDTYTTLSQEIPYTNLKLSNFSISLTNSSNSTNWFALSNPFIGKLNLSKFHASNEDVLQSTYAYVWDNTEHDWLALEDIDAENKYALYPATGFMVEGASANPTFNFNVADIVTTEPITTTKSAQANRIEFTALSNNVEMKMYAHIDDVSSNGFGRMDASILCSAKEDAVNPYMQVEGHNLLDNYFSELPATFDVNFNAYKSNAIDFALTQGMEDVEVTLIDIANANAETVLNANEPVTINVTAGQNEGRYQLRFSKKNVGINEVANEVNNISIWNSQSVVTINGKNLKRVEIYNTLGQRVYSSSLSGESTTFDSKLNNGAYIVKVYTANSSKSEKIIIR